MGPNGTIHRAGVLPASVTGAAARTGWLEDRRLAAALVAGALALVVWWIVLAVRGHRAGRRPRHPVLRRLGLTSLVMVTAVAGAGIAVNSYVGYVPDVTALVRQAPGIVGIRTAGGSTVDVYATPQHGRYSAQLRNFLLADPADRIPPGRTWVYLPTGYDAPGNATRRYPVVYLIHGYPSASYDWFGAGGAGNIAALMQQQDLIKPMIIVAPDASGGTRRDTECMDSTTGGPRLESFLTGALVRAIDSRFRTVRGRAGRAIGGLSAGGYCALNLGLRHQDEYGAVLGMEPYGDPGRNAIEYMFGGNSALGVSNSPMDYIASIPLRYPQRVFLSAATNDQETRIIARQLAARLAHRSVYVTTSFATAYGHDWREGRAELPYALSFLSAASTAAAPGSAQPHAGADGAARAGRPPDAGSLVPPGRPRLNRAAGTLPETRPTTAM